MKKYEMLLQDFFNSEEWKNRVAAFWTTYKHTGIAYMQDENGDCGSELGKYASDSYNRFNNSNCLDAALSHFERVNSQDLWNSPDWKPMRVFFYDNCSNPDKLWGLNGEEVITYFLEHCQSMLYKFLYLFAVVNGLSDEQILCIVSDKEQMNRCLNFFLCDREFANFDKNRHFAYYGIYPTQVSIQTGDGKYISAFLKINPSNKHKDKGDYVLKNILTNEIYYIRAR